MISSQEKKYFKKLSFWLIIVIFLAVAAFTYINRSYAYIYYRISMANLKSVDSARNYLIVNNQTATSSLVYAALGDSLTSGVGANKYSQSYPYLLAQYLAGNDYQVTLKDYSVPGARTQDLLDGLLPGAIKANPDVVTILIGVNDIHGKISTQEFAANYEEILSRLTKETRAKIYIINIPFIGANSLIWQPHRYLYQARTNEFNKIIKQLASKYQVNYLDLYTSTYLLLRESGIHYSDDLFHPSAEGYKIWADLIYADFNK